jgi:hypothetical protein
MQAWQGWVTVSTPSEGFQIFGFLAKSFAFFLKNGAKTAQYLRIFRVALRCWEASSTLHFSRYDYMKREEHHGADHSSEGRMRESPFAGEMSISTKMSITLCKDS